MYSAACPHFDSHLKIDISPTEFFEGPDHDISWHNDDEFESGNVLLTYEPSYD